MTFPFASFLKLCNCMISKGECLTWCDRQTAWGLENRDWKKKQANPRDSFCSFAPASPLRWDSWLSLCTSASPPWKRVYIPCSSALLEENQRIFWSLSPRFPTSSPASLYLRCHTWGLLTVSAPAHPFSSCPQVPFTLPSAIWIPYFVTCKEVMLPTWSLSRAEYRTRTARSEWEEGKCPGEAGWHHELALSPD